MEVTHLLVVCLLVGPSALSVRAEKKAEVGEVTEAPITEDQKKVYAECRNPDYKKYVKCLMRPKRHHGHHANHGDELPETGRSPIAITIEINMGIRVPLGSPRSNIYYATAAVARSLREINRRIKLKLLDLL